MNKSIWIGDFIRVLKRERWAFDCYGNANSPNTPAGLTFNGEKLLSVPKGQIPENTVLMDNGGVKARGWRQLVDVLSGKRLIKRDRVLRAINKL